MTRLVGLLAVAALLFIAPTARADSPQITYSCTPAPANCSTWYRTDVTLEFTITASSILRTEGCGLTRVTSDTPGAEFKCEVWTSTGYAYEIATIQRDATPPTVSTPSTSTQPANGWLNQPFSATFAGADATSGIATCTTATYAGPDTANGALTGTCTDNAGNTSAPAAFSFRYDATPPEVTGSSLSRQPDGNGWYTKPVTVTFAGVDATSGIESCTSAEYAGPDGAASVAGSCRDRAGNVGQQRIASFKYDATPPALDAAAAEQERGSVVLRWQASPDTATVEVERSPGTRGRPQTVVFRGKASSFRDARMPRNKRYRYVVTALDEAGNRAARTLDVFVAPALYSPAPGARVSSPPLLQWDRDPKASYYNVQLFRGRQKVLTLWPKQPRLKLKRSWRYQGARQRLTRGRYTWYVWPGRGPRAKARYGKLIGSSAFVVRR